MTDQEEPGTRVVFAGLGAMGGGMCRRLAERGFAVTAFDLDPALARAAAAEQPRVTAAGELAGLAAPVVVTMLPDGAAVRQVAEQLLPSLAPGTLLIDTSSCDPRDTAELVVRAAEFAVRVVDAPVSGSPAAARAGELTLMAAGAPADLDAAEPVLAALGRAHRVGPSGAGHALKALNNLLSAVNLAAVAEVLLAGTHFGLAPAVMLEVINASTGRNHASETKLVDQVLPGSFDSGFALRLMLKDIRIADALVAGTGGPAGFTGACHALWEEAAAALPAGADNTEVVRHLELVGGRELRG
ncbi:NAD(P)-dependent oxidoreductase [Kitasatospora sp. NPDC008050]|uniref:NAD(P)-dependent oxidoreductase n=1 Tax=Kitasatospora sp. NPDC008050 TaxID=3364021 RepID=UPI0036E6DE12